ncbi:Type IIB DNA topoisomerase-like protein [Elsinoe fawcettii]|nr:Type IIB DNA topoisomerase-like protein [Elsinoe fawcettii]
MIRLVTQLSKGQLMSFSLKDGEFEAGLEEESELQGRLFAFPGTGPEESWRFTVMVKILGHIHEACVTNTIVSKRDIYYHDPSLFGSQATVDRHIDQIAAELHVRRSDLNVTAAAKGLITGAATMDYQNGSMDDLSLCSDIKLIASCERLMTVSLSSAKFILVVEKEVGHLHDTRLRFAKTKAGKLPGFGYNRNMAACEASCNRGDSEHLEYPMRASADVSQGKGYPDIATRRLLHLLAHPTAFNHFADPPVYLLTDFDPDGIAIANVYKHGSLNLTHEGDGIKTTKAQRLGLTREHVQEDDSMMGSHVLLPMTMRDRRKARTMLVRMVGSSEMTDDTSDLQCMLMTNLKAELQTLDEGHGGLNKLLASLIPG